MTGIFLRQHRVQSHQLSKALSAGQNHPVVCSPRDPCFLTHQGLDRYLLLFLDCPTHWFFLGCLDPGYLIQLNTSSGDPFLHLAPNLGLLSWMFRGPPLVTIFHSYSHCLLSAGFCFVLFWFLFAYLFSVCSPVILRSCKPPSRLLLFTSCFRCHSSWPTRHLEMAWDNSQFSYFIEVPVTHWTDRCPS